MDASFTGWGTVCNGRITKGKWPVSLQNAHTNFLELLSVSGIESFCAVSAEPPCCDQIRQHNGSGLYKLSGGHTLSSAS